MTNRQATRPPRSKKRSLLLLSLLGVPPAPSPSAGGTPLPAPEIPPSLDNDQGRSKTQTRASRLLRRDGRGAPHPMRFRLITIPFLPLTDHLFSFQPSLPHRALPNPINPLCQTRQWQRLPVPSIFCNPDPHPWRYCHSQDIFLRLFVFYSEATDSRAAPRRSVDVDPVGLVRHRASPAGKAGTPGQYVNDRPYVASSFLGGRGFRLRLGRPQQERRNPWTGRCR